MSIKKAKQLHTEAYASFLLVDSMFWASPTLDNRLAKIRSNAARRVYRRWVMIFGGK